MSDTRNASSWTTLPNPFLRRTKNQNTEEPDPIIGYVSGRSSDIAEIIMEDQSAILLAGAPHIGKTALINYLSDTSHNWSWRNELASLSNLVDLEAIHFIQIDLTPLEDETLENLYQAFQRQCALAVLSVQPENDQAYSADLASLRQFLRQAKQDTPHARYFVMLDTIERLGRFNTQTIKVDGEIKTPQDQGLALLQQCGAIRMLIDLNDEFSHFGILLSIEHSPRPTLGSQFSRVSTHLSDDLARFSTMTLKAFSREDALQFLGQAPESFGSAWTQHFRALGGTSIFTDKEQEWLLEQAGTHPHLLQMLCFNAFSYKRKYADQHHSWSALESTSKRQVLDTVNERLSTFLTGLWNRAQQALEQSEQEAKQQFYQWLLAPDILPNLMIADEVWNKQRSDLRYILANEGIISYDKFQHAYYPGALLLDYLIQQARSTQPYDGLPTLTPIHTGFWLSMTCPGSKAERLALTELEYRLLQTLLQHPPHCTEEMLMEGAWGKEIERSAFMQRMHHLRKKLKKHCGATEIIENRYGGLYFLTHPEWFQLQ